MVLVVLVVILLVLVGDMDYKFKADFDTRLYRLYCSLCKYFIVPSYRPKDERLYSGNLFPHLASVFRAVWSNNIYLKCVYKSSKDKKS